MESLVIDASVALAWALPDEGQAEQARAVLASVAVAGGVVPGHWRTEVGNVLVMALRRKRLTLERLPLVMAELSTLNLAEDTRGPAAAWEDPLELALAESLRLYDALYLELAIRRRLALASFDKALRRAAERRGVEVLPALP